MVMLNTSGEMGEACDNNYDI